MLIFNGKIEDDAKELLEVYVKELEEYFDISDIPIEIVTCNDRNDFDKRYGEPTQRWMIGFARDGKIFLFEQSVIEKESSFHKKEEFIQIAKHEICHLFVHKLNPEASRFFNEGLCLNFAHQNRTAIVKKENYDKFFIDFYVPLNTNEFMERQGYQLSYMVVKNILKYFAKDNVLKLLKISRRDHEWKQKIEKITGLVFSEYLNKIKEGIKTKV